MIHSINNTHEICDKFLYNTINYYHGYEICTRDPKIR